MQTTTYPLLIVQALTFIAAIFATIWAIELYSLLKTGEVGKTWRVVVIATLLFAVSEIEKFGETYQYLPTLNLHEYLDLPFILLLAIACYMQRKAFFMPQHFRRSLVSRVTSRNGNEDRADGYGYTDDSFDLEELEMLEPVDDEQ
ncbi:MAG: hypothetical protein HY318_02090 [Armatimonadetes bacterium]|nr:hypothetical protein [Armatimonadota bacterium]